MPTRRKGTKNADLEPVCRHSKRGVLAIATTTTSPRRSGQGAAPTAPAAAVTGTGGAAAAAALTGTVGAAAAVNTSSRCSGCNTIAVSDAATSITSSAPNPGSSINATSSGHSQPTATDLLCDEMEEEEQTHAY